MSFELPQSPDDVTEAHLTALLLGELSAEDERTLRAALAQDAKLAQLHERLARTMGLVREAAGSLREEATPPAEELRLSAERREKLLRQFKLTHQHEAIRPKRPSANWREWAAVAAMLMGLVAVAGMVVSNVRHTAEGGGSVVGDAIHFAFDFRRARLANPATISSQTTDTQSDELNAGALASERSAIPSPSLWAFHYGDPSGGRPSDVAKTKTDPKSSEAPNSSVPRGSQIALPQIAHAVDSAVDQLADLNAESVASSKAPARYGAIPAQEKDRRSIEPDQAMQGRGYWGGSMGLGGLGGVPGNGNGQKHLTITPGLTVAKDALVTAEPRPTVAQGDEILAFRSTGASRDNRELSETTLRQQIAAVDSTWMATPTLPPAAPVIVPPPAPPGALADHPGLGIADSENFVVRDFGATPQPAKERLERNRFDAKKNPGSVSVPTPAPTPAYQPNEPAAAQPFDTRLASRFFDTSLPAQTAKSSGAPVVAEQENRFGTAQKPDVVALQPVNATEFTGPANGAVPIERAWAQSPMPTKPETSLGRTGLVEAKNEKSVEETRGPLSGLSVKDTEREELKLNAPASGPVELRRKAYAIALPPEATREKDAKRQTQSQSGVTAGKPVTLESEVKLAKKAEDLSELEENQGAEEARRLRRTPEVPVPQPDVATAENAFSTFSLNVSDVSFKLAAAALEKGQMPDPATIRSEEFINAFDYRDAEPGGSAPIAFAWERARYPFAHDRDLIRFSVKTAASGRQPGRPLNLVLLIDNSGSMERADRVRIRQECLRVLASQIQSLDRVSVVSFARTARLWVDGMPGSQAGELPQRVGGLTPEGGTNLEEAMNVAYQTALRHFLPNGVNRVVLLTDGAANLGDVQPESLKKRVEAHRRQGIALDCFGIGWDGLNDELLEALSRNGDGRYGFVNTPEAAANEFAGQLAGALKVAASDVKVQVEWNPRRVTAYRQIGYAKHQLKKEQFRDNTVDAAEIGAAEAGNALYAAQVNPRGEGPLGTVRVRFKVPGTGDYREHEWTLTYDGNAGPLDQSSPALRLAASASAFSEWLASGPFAAEVTPDKLLSHLSGVPEIWPADPRPKKLEWMIRQAKSVSGR